MPRPSPFPSLVGALLAISAPLGCYGIPACRENLDCPNGQACVLGTCQPSAFTACAAGGPSCPSGEVCLNAICQADCVVQGCAQDQRCDPDSHRCENLFYASTNGGGSGTSGTTGGSGTGGTTSGGTTGGTTGPPPVPFCGACLDGSCGSALETCNQDARGFNYCGSDCTSGQACPAQSSCTPTQSFNPANGERIYNCLPQAFLCWCSPTTDTWANYAQAFFQNNCTGCHFSGSGLDAFNSYANVQAASLTIALRIDNGSMPLDGVLSSPDKQRLLNWIACDLPP